MHNIIERRQLPTGLHQDAFQLQRQVLEHIFQPLHSNHFPTLFQHLPTIFLGFLREDLAAWEPFWLPARASRGEWLGIDLDAGAEWQPAA